MQRPVCICWPLQQLLDLHRKLRYQLMHVHTALHSCNLHLRTILRYVVSVVALLSGIIIHCHHRTYGRGRTYLYQHCPSFDIISMVQNCRHRHKADRRKACEELACFHPPVPAATTSRPICYFCKKDCDERHAASGMVPHDMRLDSNPQQAGDAMILPRNSHCGHQ